MNQRLSTWASISEIASGIGVIVTLIFLIVGIRENTEITRATAFDRNMESINQWRFDLAKDTELTRIWQNQSDFQGLNETDQFRLIMLWGSLWGIYEKSYYSYSYDLIGRNEWSRFEVQMCQRKEEMGSRAFDSLSVSTLTKQFSDFVEQLCSDSLSR